MSLASRTRLGSYEISARIGQGGMGEVYRATDTNLKRQVALKVLPADVASDVERLARLQREAEVLASLNHPNIAAIYGIERTDGVLALVMELVEGPTLAERIAAGPMSLDEALPIARQIADALDSAHERGIVHRDLKPANVKVRPDGTVKLLDFGLAKAIDGAGPAGSAATLRPAASLAITSPAVTEAGVILGTAAYMSPEQARGRPADSRSDIWAFGVVLAEMTTGRRLFGRETVSDTIAAVLTHEPDLADVPPRLQRLIRQCLVKDPRVRLRHIGDAMSLIDDSPATVTRERPSRWRSLAVISLLIASAAITLTLAWLLMRHPATDAPVTTFYVDAPPEAAFNYTYTGSALSPDGRQVVFRVATSTEAPALWLRPLDSLTGRRLAGTDGADFPFWSPDGRSVAFFSAGKLKRLDASGGTPVVLCDASDADSTATGGSWNRNGVILYGAPQGLYRVSASGGTPALIAAVDSRSGETGYGDPQFLPDEDRFLFYVRTSEQGHAGYYVSSLSHPERKTLLLNTSTKAVFVEANGADYLLYLQGRTLLARRVDLRALALTGDPVPLADDVALFPPGFQASFWSSTSGALLAYRAEASDKPRLTWIYPDGKRQPATGTEDFFTHVRVSPDGSRAAMELAAETGSMDVWTRDFGRGVNTRQTFDPSADRAPTWAPNGHELAFTSGRSGVWQLFRKDVASGLPEEQLTTSSGDKTDPDWSHDGQYLVYVQSGATTAQDVWALPLTGDRQPFPVLQTPAIEADPALSPDGEWLAFASAQSGRPEVIVTRFPRDRNAVSASAPRWQVSTLGGSRPRWSSDGRALFYVSLDVHGIMRAQVRGTAAGFESDVPRVFADIAVMPVARSPFDVTADGRVLLLERTVNHAAPLIMVANWPTLMSTR